LLAAARGKTVFNIPLISTTAFNEIVDEGEAEAAKMVGLKFVESKNEGNPSQWVAGMNQAIGQKVDLIILEGSPDPRSLTVQLAEAKSVGIPVISTHFYDESVAQQQLTELNLAAIVPANHYVGGGTLPATYAMLEAPICYSGRSHAIRLPNICLSECLGPIRDVAPTARPEAASLPASLLPCSAVLRNHLIASA
jgi:hypothetical protein